MAPPRKTKPPDKDAPAWRWYYWRNREAVLKRQKERYEQNRKEMSKSRRSYYERNRAKVLAYQNAYNRRKRGPRKTQSAEELRQLKVKIADKMTQVSVRNREIRGMIGMTPKNSRRSRLGGAQMSLKEKKKHLQERGIIPVDPPEELKP